YLEHDNIYRQLQVDWGPESTAGTPWWTNANNWTMGQSRLKVFQCPSDNLDGGVSVGAVVGVYYPPDALGQIRLVWYPPPLANQVGLTNYLGVSGAFLDTPDPYWGQWVGLLNNRSRTSLAKVPDGTSNTLLFGEYLGHVIDNDRQFAMAWMGAPYAGTVGGLRGPREGHGGGFSSPHAAVGQVCFAAGSGRGVSRGGTACGPYPATPPTHHCCG